MEYYEKAKEMIAKAATSFVGGVSEREIENAMRSLSVTFPESYKAFLRDFGGGEIDGKVILGITKDEEKDIVIATEMGRGVGLPNYQVIIGFWDDILVCLDTGKMENGECPVVEGNYGFGATAVIADTFGRFLYEYLKVN
jgi:hypothetical protein